MHIQIYSPGFQLSDELRAYVSKRLASALNHGKDLVSKVVVRFSDVNGHRGGVDKRCAVEVRLKGAGTITIDETQSALPAAIDLAAERCGHTLDRRLAQRHRRAVHAASRRQSFSAWQDTAQDGDAHESTD